MQGGKKMKTKERIIDYIRSYLLLPHDKEINNNNYLVYYTNKDEHRSSYYRYCSDLTREIFGKRSGAECHLVKSPSTFKKNQYYYRYFILIKDKLSVVSFFEIDYETIIAGDMRTDNLDGDLLYCHTLNKDEWSFLTKIVKHYLYSPQNRLKTVCGDIRLSMPDVLKPIINDIKEGRF